MRALWLLALVGCTGSGAGDTGFKEGVTFDDVLPVFDATCSPCHMGAIKPRGGFRLDDPSTFVEVAQSTTGMSFVEPGSLDESYLWHKIEDTHLELDEGNGSVMPPLDVLSPKESEIIRAWILGGALPGQNNDSLIALCDDAPKGCEIDCEPGPASVEHAPWHNRLTESPHLSWDPVSAAVGYEVALGSHDGSDDAECWTDVGDSTSHVFREIWVLESGESYVASVRAVFADGTRSEFASSAGWTVDITPPQMPTAPIDDRVVVDGTVHWQHPATDAESGFRGFEIALGSSPGAQDAVDWTDVGTELSATIVEELAGLAQGQWYWLAVSALDVAGNRSPAAVSGGFITCPQNYSFVPGDEELGSTPFCVARYEMRMSGNDDGSTPFTSSVPPESRASGTPWSSVDKGQARGGCDSIGFSYQLITNQQWQTVARSIERTDTNWSGGLVGSGAIPTGHSDYQPQEALASEGSPCVGTQNANCEDQYSEDFGQRRTHDLHNGEVVWDLAGNLTEHVDGSTGGPSGYWMSFDSGAFTSDEGWQDYRARFAPAGLLHTEAHGMGQMYGGTEPTDLTRGGSFNPSTYAGIFQAHHRSWSTGPSNGFRCVFVPM
jgi:hypothetical protein